LPLIKTSDNRTISTSTRNENKIVKNQYVQPTITSTGSTTNKAPYD